MAATNYAALSVTISADISSITPAVLEAMEEKVAQNMVRSATPQLSRDSTQLHPPATPGSTKFHQVPSDATSPAPNAQGVAAANVDITASAGSVVLAISIGYDSATEATSAATTLETVMATADDATAMLTTTALAVTATTVTAPVTGAGAAVPSPPSPPPPPPPVSPDDDGLSVGVVAGIAVGGSVVVIAIIVGVMLAMKKKKAVSPSKSAVNGSA